MKRAVTIHRVVGDSKLVITGIVHLGTFAPDDPDEVIEIAADCIRDIGNAIESAMVAEPGDLAIMEDIERDLISHARAWAHSHGIDTAWDATDIRDANGVRGV